MAQISILPKGKLLKEETTAFDLEHFEYWDGTQLLRIIHYAGKEIISIFGRTVSLKELRDFANSHALSEINRKT